MKHLLSVALWVCLAVGCSVLDNSSENEAKSDETEELAMEALQISGSLANGEDPEATEILAAQPVQVLRNDGTVVGDATSGEDGSFNVELAAGALVIDTNYSLLGDDSASAATEKPTTDEFSYYLEVKVPDDGTGKAIGLRKKIGLGKSAVSDGVLDLGTNPLKEVSAIIGSVAFADTLETVENVDIFIPGKQFFVRTGDEGTFALLFVPSGNYKLRIVKGYHIKDVDVSVTAGKTLNLGEVEIGLDDRNPGPLATVLIGSWVTKCYYRGVGVDNPSAGTVTFSSLTSFSTTGSSCVMRTLEGPTVPGLVKAFTLGDGLLAIEVTGNDFRYNAVSGYSNNRIVFTPDTFALPGNNHVEVWERQN